MRSPLKVKSLTRVLKLALTLSLAGSPLGCDDASTADQAEMMGEVTSGESAGGGEELAGGEPEPGREFEAELGLSASVRVRFDEVSGLHLTCQRAEDCFAAQGYYHAAHRFTQMDINRLFPQGRLTERIGNLALDIDQYSRLIFSRRDGSRIERQMWDASSEESKRMLTAYARGVNAWLMRWRASGGRASGERESEVMLSAEYSVSIFDTSTITEWDPLDSLSVALVLIQDLTERSRSQISAGYGLATLGPELYTDLFGTAPAFPTSVLSGAEGVDAVAPAISSASDGDSSDKDDDGAIERRLNGARALYQRLASHRETLNLPHLEALKSWRAPIEDERNPLGSNNWVVSPDRSASGAAWLSNDPHLGLSNPSVWYLTHIKVEPAGPDEPALNVSGVSLPGIPSIVIGHNEHIAWGMTTTYFDFSDVYLDPLSESGDAVRFNGEDVPLIRREDRFVIGSTGEEVTRESLFVPHHGPVLSIDRDQGVAVTMRWTAQDTDTDVDFLLELARASSVDEAREAIKSVTTIGQNFVVADDQGHIGWFPYNRLPSRPWATPELDPGFPLPGDGSAEWGEPIPYEELPQLVDPDQGFIVTANHDMTGAFNDGDATNDARSGPAQALQQAPAPGYRYSQSTRLVAREEPHDRASLTDAVHDRESLLARRLLPALIGAVDIMTLSESGQRLLGVLSDWGSGPRGYDCPAGVSLESLDLATPSADPRERADSAGCFAFHVLYGYLSAQVFSDELAEVTSQEIIPDNEALAKLIARPEVLARGVAYWDDVSTPTEEDAGLTIAEAMNRAGSYFSREYGTDPDAWLWGLAHTVTLSAAVLSDAGLTLYDNGPYPNHGGLYTVDVANPSSVYRRAFEHSAGASMRFVCELTSPPRCQIEVPGGQRHHRDSPHYDDLLRRWLDRAPTPMPFTDDEIDASLTEELSFPEELR